MVYDLIEENVRWNGEKYEDAHIKGVFLNIYYEVTNWQADFPIIPAVTLIARILDVLQSELVSGSIPKEVQSLMHKPSRVPSTITSIKSNATKCRAFIVADIETVMVDNIHVPYAAGFLVVNPADDLTCLQEDSDCIQMYFSEDHIPVYSKFADRSHRMLFYFVFHLE